MDPHQQFIEETLIHRSRSGDDVAFARLVELHYGPLMYFVRRMIGSEDAHDVVQEVWLAAYCDLRKLKEVSAFRPWLYRIARNHSIDSLRSRRKNVPLETVDERGLATGPEPQFSPEDAAQIHTALAKLGLEHREILMLRFLEEMSYQEIADVTGCDLGTVKSRLFYAKHALRREMETMS